MLITEQMQPAIDSRNSFNHHPPIGSVCRLLSGTDDGSCRGTSSSTSKRDPLQAETRNQCNRALTGISLLQEILRSGISAV